MTPDLWCPSVGRHGTRQAYNADRCRCTAARADIADYSRVHYHRRQIEPLKVNSTGTRRRLEALGAAGWPAEDIAALFGVGTGEALRSMRIRDSILSSSAAKITQIYAELRGIAGPSERTRRRSRMKGWLPPSSWDGVNIDDPRARPVDPWRRYLDARPALLLPDRDVLDDQADLEIDARLDAIDADDEAWFAARARRAAA